MLEGWSINQFVINKDYFFFETSPTLGYLSVLCQAKCMYVQYSTYLSLYLLGLDIPKRII